MTFTTWCWSLEERPLTWPGMDFDLQRLTSSYMLEYEDDVMMMDIEMNDVEHEAMEVDEEEFDEEMDWSCDEQDSVHELSSCDEQMSVQEIASTDESDDDSIFDLYLTTNDDFFGC